MIQHYKLVFPIRMGLKVDEIDLTTRVEFRKSHWLDHNDFFDAGFTKVNIEFNIMTGSVLVFG